MPGAEAGGRDGLSTLDHTSRPGGSGAASTSYRENCPAAAVRTSRPVAIRGERRVGPTRRDRHGLDCRRAHAPQRLVAEVISWCERAAAGDAACNPARGSAAPPSRSASSPSALRTASAPVRPAQRRRQPRGRLPPSTRRRGRVGRSRCRSRPTVWRWSDPTCWWPAARPAPSAPPTWGLPLARHSGGVARPCQGDAAATAGGVREGPNSSCRAITRAASRPRPVRASGA
jgi:hypothetical protein